MSLPLIVIKSIHHDQQDYETCGNYKEVKYDNGRVCHITVSRVPNWKMEGLVAVHELIEYILVKHNKISIKEIDEFDYNFEENRKAGNTDEPGDDPNAPYHLQHVFATQIEKLLATELGISWEEYNDIIEKLCKT